MILTGDCRDILPTLGAESVDCCVTSPPYALGLRNYGDFPNQIGHEPTLEEYIETITDFVEAQTDYLNHIRKSKRAVKHRERLTWKPINRTSRPKPTKHPATQKRTRKMTCEKTLIETPWFPTISGVTAM